MTAKDNLLMGRIVGARVLLAALSEDKRFSLIARWKAKRALSALERIEGEYAEIRRREKNDVS